MAEIPSLEGVSCNVCNAGTLTMKTATQGNYVGQSYYVCTNWNLHNQHKEKGDPLKGPWILANDVTKINAYLNPNKRPAPASANALGFKKLKPAAPAAINQDAVLVTISAKVAHIQTQLDHVIGLLEAKNSQDEDNNEEAAE